LTAVKLKTAKMMTQNVSFSLNATLHVGLKAGCT